MSEYVCSECETQVRVRQDTWMSGALYLTCECPDATTTVIRTEEPRAKSWGAK